MSINVPFTAIVRKVANGQAINADNTNAGPTDLTARTDYLKNQLDSLEAGQLLVATDAVLQSAMPIGTPVYIDLGTNTARPAEVALADDVVGGLAAPSSYVFGLVLNKQTDTSGDIGMEGLITSITTTQWASVMEAGTFAAGHYFLSGSVPGKISLSPGALAVYVGLALPNGWFLARPQPPVYGAHSHYQFTLTGAPAGTVVDPTIGNPQIVNTPNASLPGWLPATTTYFAAGTIPVGAKFGYNLPQADPDLRAVFPPIPVTGQFEQGGLFLDTDKVLVNQFGIWWMDNTYGNAPWPVDYSVSHTAEPIEFFFSRLLFATGNGVVTELSKDPASILDIQVINAAGQPAATGKLRLRVTSLLPNSSDADEGALAVKSISGGVHTRGPAVTRIFPGAGVVISGANGDALTGFYGPLTLSLVNSEALQGSAENVNLNNAREDYINDLPMAMLAVGRAAAPTFGINVSTLAPASSSLVLKPWLYSSLSGNLPSLVVQYRIIPAPGTSQVVPSGWSTLVNLSGTAVVGAQQKQLTLPAIAAVPAGAIVLVQIVRGNADGFNGNIGVARLDFALA